MAWLRRLVNLVRAERLGRDIDREMAFHLAEKTDELIAGGMTEEDARREARRRFGHPERVKESVHEVDVLGWLESAFGDVRYAARSLRGSPGFTLVAVLSLGLGIGANTAIFSLINAVLLRSLPVRNPEEVVQVTMGEDNATFTNPQWEQIRDRPGPLAGSFAFADRVFNLANGGEVRRAAGAWVSGDYFRVLGVSATRGRLIEPGDDVRGCPAVAVLGHGFWEQEYGGAESAVGGTISLGGHGLTILGVVEPGFSGISVGRSASVFVPLCVAEILGSRPGMLDARSMWFLNVFGRLSPDATLEGVRASLAAMAPAVFEATTPTNWAADEQREYFERTLTVDPGGTGISSLRDPYREALMALLIVVGVVLLIACANVAQLLMARAAARQHEVAIRLAIGAGRARLIRQLLTESLLLSLLGAAAGMLFARWSNGLLVGFLSTRSRQVWLDLSIDSRVLGFTIAVAVATGILFGLAPAWRSTAVAPQGAMQGRGRSVVGEARVTFGKAIVAGQVALSLVLVMVAALLVGSFQRLTHLDPGFRRDGVLVAELNWSALKLSEDRERLFPVEVLERLRAMPGVRSASASFTTPIGNSIWNEDIAVAGFAPKDTRDANVLFNGVSDGYLATTGTNLLAGRDFTPQDQKGSVPVVLVNEALARRFFGGASPLGRELRVQEHDGLGPPKQIVGVVQDAKYQSLTEEMQPTAYVPLGQTSLWGPGIIIAMRSDGPPSALGPSVTAALREIDPAISVELTTFDAQVAESLARPRLLATLSGFFGGLALLLAVVGLYGTMSYNVTRRRSEIGVRIALGAARSSVLGMVARDVVSVIAIGVLLGGAFSLASTRIVASFLFGVTPSDPATLVLSALVLGLVAAAAGLVPAWRAARVDPMAALREE